MEATADLEATAETEATADPETAAEDHRSGAGVHHTQVDEILLHRPLADQANHRGPTALSHPPKTTEIEVETADAIDFA